MQGWATTYGMGYRDRVGSGCWRPHPSPPAVFHRPLSLLLLAVAVAASGCGSSNRPDEVSLDGRRVAVTAAIPPAPRVQAGSPLEAGIDPADPIGTAVRVGTSLEKRRQARRAQARLDSVVATVDAADRPAAAGADGRAAPLCAGLGPRAPTSCSTSASPTTPWSPTRTGAVYFLLLGDVRLLDARTGAPLWDAELRERQIVDRSLFGLPAAVGNVFTGRSLAG